MGRVVELSDREIDRLLAAEAAFVDFWGPDCAPCRVIVPIVEGLAESYGERMAFFKVNVDENPQTTAKFGIMGIPTLVLLRRGTEVKRIIGATSRARIQNYIDQTLQGTL